MNGDRADTSESERSLSSALIGGAFGFIGIAIFSSASYADKVSPNSLWWGNLLVTSSVLLLVASVICAGRGWTRKNSPGFFNPFNLQAWCGLLGILVLGGGAAIFAFNPKIDTRQVEMLELLSRIQVLEKAVSTQQASIDALSAKLVERDAGTPTGTAPP